MPNAMTPVLCPLCEDHRAQHARTLDQKIRILEAKERMFHDEATRADERWKRCLEDLVNLRIERDDLKERP